MTDKTSTAEREAAQFTACDMATASAQGFRDGVASLALPGAQEAVVWAMFADNGNIRLWSKKPIPHPDAIPLYAAPQPALSAGWQPIETAPKDSTARLVWCPERQNIYCVTWLKGHRWVLFGGPALTEEPTHWMPLPASPTIEGESNV